MSFISGIMSVKEYDTNWLRHFKCIFTSATQRTNCIRSFQTQTKTSLNVLWCVSNLAELYSCICSSEGLAAANMHLHFLSSCFHAHFSYFFFFFYLFSDRPTQNRKTHSTITEEKKGMTLLIYYVVRLFVV